MTLGDGQLGRSGRVPRVSVVIPTWQRRDIVCESIESALAQTVKDVEVLVVDDGSTDGTTPALCARYAGDPRVRVFRKENGGTASARNRGLEEVQAPSTAFLDSDDLWMPHYLEGQLGVLAREGADAVLSDARYEGGDRGRSQFEDAWWKPPTSLDGVLGGGWGLPSTLVVRSEVAKALCFDATYRYSEDTEFLIRLHLAGHRLVLNPAQEAIWRHPGGGRKTDERDAEHIFAEIRMRLPHRHRRAARRSLRAHFHWTHRRIALEMIEGGCWREARPHLAAWVRGRPLRPRVIGRWLRSLCAPPSRAPVPEATADRSVRLLAAARACSGVSPAHPRPASRNSITA